MKAYGDDLYVNPWKDSPDAHNDSNNTLVQTNEAHIQVAPDNNPNLPKNVFVDAIWGMAVLETRSVMAEIDPADNAKWEKLGERCAVENKICFGIAASTLSTACLAYFSLLHDFRNMSSPIAQRTFESAIVASSVSVASEGMILAMLGKEGFTNALRAGNTTTTLTLMWSAEIILLLAVISVFVGLFTVVFEGNSPKGLS